MSANNVATARTSSPWVPIYMDDLTAATHWWTPAAMGVYMRLLLHQASHGAIPGDEPTLRRIVGATEMSAEEWRAICEVVLPKFERDDSGLLRNARLSREMETRQAVRSTKLEQQERSAAARRQAAYRERKRNALRHESITEHNEKRNAAIATSTSTSTSTTDVVDEAQLELSTAMVARPDNGDDDALGCQLLRLMGLRARPLSDVERELIASKRHLLTPEAIARLKAWYFKGRKKDRKTPDALEFLLRDLERCLDQSSRVSVTPPKKRTAPTPEFLEWLKSAELTPREECLRDDAANAWLILSARYRKERARAA